MYSRDLKQVQNAKYRALNKNRVSRDAMANIYVLSENIDVIREFRLKQHFTVVLASNFAIEQTFQLYLLPPKQCLVFSEL